MAATKSRIVELAQVIRANTERVEQYLQDEGIPLPSFDEHAPKTMVLDNKDVERRRVEAVSAAAELQELLQGPYAALNPFTNATALEAVFKWNLPANVPRDGEISYTRLAARVGLKEAMLKRLIRAAIVLHRCFQEKRDGYVSHSAASRLLADDPDMFSILGMIYGTSWHAFAKTCESLQTFECSEEPVESAFSLAICPGKSLWDFYAENPDEGERFSRAMKAYTSRPGYSLSFLIDSYPWQSLTPGTKVVDVGGGQGHASIAIAKAFPGLSFVVQDLPDVIKTEKIANVPHTVQFVGHDFFNEQTIEAGLYLFRWVLHDWPDKYVVQILRNLIPSLRAGARVVINDSCLPKLGSIPNMLERGLRAYDMSMLAFFNAKERTENDWYDLFTQADLRFQNLRSWTPDGAALSIIEATWVDGQDQRT